MTTRFEFKPVIASNGTPLYAAVRDSVHSAIESGQVNPGERLPSTKELSELMNVSLVTVHRALNELVSSGVLRRGQGRGTFVHENYAKPGHIASDVRFGMVFHPESTMADPYHGRIFQGVRDEAMDRGIDLVLLRYNEDWRRECSGFLYVNPYQEQFDTSPRYGANRGQTTTVQRDSLPIVSVGAQYETRDDVLFIDTDNVGMIRRAVELLVEQGHERIAFLGAGQPASNNADRETGYREGMAAAKLAIDEELVIHSSAWRLSEVELNGLVELLLTSDRPTAIVAAGYYLALDVYTSCRKANLTIPEDLSVVGVDDPPSAECLAPPLTTFWQPLEELGRRAVTMLAEALDSQSGPSERVVLPTELMERESVAPPPQAIGTPDRSAQSTTKGVQS
ncbi:MAG: GntR family transcriptional regulator [Planctomycetota bacterium]